MPISAAVIGRNPDPLTNIRRPGNQGQRERPPAAYLISSAANGRVMDRERIALIFFFGFLALMGYELYLLLSPFLVPLAWAMLLAFIAHPALLQLDRLIRSRTAAALIITAILALVIAVPTGWLSSKLALEATVSLGQFFHRGGIAQAGSQALHSSMINSIESWLEQQGLRIEDVRHWMGKTSTYL
ncbi:MAG TPA: hypothetical protein VGP23_13265, partial [Candidatus Binataceae bacterium]|nr:hypothetical protein [Candidatus Binataceae bacterium]